MIIGENLSRSFDLHAHLSLAEILNAFAQFPEHTFLWKYEECDNDTAPFADFPNVVVRPWWPQTDLLGHPKIKAFITHAGMNSMLEVAFRGKPAITIPLFADQYINAKNSGTNTFFQ